MQQYFISKLHDSFFIVLFKSQLGIMTSLTNNNNNNNNKNGTHDNQTE